MRLSCRLAAVLLLSTLAVAQNPAPAAAPPQAATAPQTELQRLVQEGRKLNSEGHQDEALKVLARALELNPNDFDAQIATGVALDLLGNYGDGRRHFTKAIEVATPEQKPQAMRQMAFSYAFERKPAEAAKFEQPLFDTRLAANDFTGAGEIANELARIYIESGDIENAAKWYKQGYETALRKKDLTGPQRALWQFRWEHAQARLAARRGNKEEANQHVALAKRALDETADKDQQVFYPYLTGYVAFYLGDPKTAITDLQQANQRDPFILALMAQAYDKTGQQQQAQDLYKKIMTMSGHNPTNAFARPLARQKLGL
jgi:tetratricopeptide (TPR) repeat protein